MHFHPNVHSHESPHPFHQSRASRPWPLWERPGFAAHPVEIGNLLLILLGVALALMFYPF
jgi:hypothetical protein